MDELRAHGRRIGPHLPVAEGLVKAADRAHDIGATAVQVFTDNPIAWRRREVAPDELAEFRRRLADYDIAPIAVHASYLINLCGADALFWQRSIESLAAEMEMSARYGASFVNVHVGSHRGHGRQDGLRQLARGLARVLDRSGAPSIDHAARPMLVLENAPGSGDGIGSSIEDLADILDVAAGEGVADGAIGFCLDTAHLWAAGYCIDGPAGVADVVAKVDRLVGRQRVAMLHLNDARTVCASRVDRHEHVGAGHIGETGLAAVLTHPWLATLPTYLETPAMDAGYDSVNLNRVSRLIRGQPLEALPQDAFSTRRGRARRAPRSA